MLSREAAAY